MKIRRTPHFSRLLLTCAAPYIAVDFLALPKSAGVKQLINVWCDPLIGVARSGKGVLSFDAAIHQDQEGLTLNFAPGRHTDADVVGHVCVFPARRLEGFWAATSERFRPKLYFAVFPPKEPFDDRELSSIRDQFADYMQSDGSQEMVEFAQWIREGREVVARPLVMGYLRNGGSGFCALIILMHLMQSSRNKLESARESRLLSEGRCPKCQFDLTGNCEAGCPECGWMRGV